MINISNRKKIDIQSLSQSEKIMLAEELWDSIAENQNELDVTESQKKLLDDRLKEYKDSPKEGESWEDVKKDMK